MSKPLETPSEQLKQQITDICFKNGGVTKPMVEELYNLIKQREEQHELEIRLDELEHHENQGLSWLYYYPRRKEELTK